MQTDERWKFALSASDLGVWDWHVQANEIYFSERLFTMLGYAPDELAQEMGAWKDRIHPDDLDRTLRTVKDQLEGRTALYEAEYRMRAKDGSYRWILDRGKVVTRDADGHPTRMTGTHSDITSRKRTEDALRHHQEILQETGRIAKVGGWELDPQTGQGTWTDEVARIHDLEPGSAIGLELALQFYEPSSRARIEAALKKAIEEGIPYDLELELKSAKGHSKCIRTIGHPVFENDRIVKLRGAFQDITEQKAAEALARSNDERFHILAHATNDAIWDWDMATGEVWWNEGYEKLFGYQKGELQPSYELWGQLIHPDERERVLEGMRTVVEGTENRWTDEYRFRRRDGSFAFVMDRGRVIRDPDGKALRMVGGMTDLTERKRAEEKLREQAALLDRARDAILVRDLNHRILYWNRGAERHYGWRAEEAVGCSVIDLLYEDSLEFFAAMQATLEQGEWVGELEQKTRDGRMITVRAHWSLMSDGGDQPESILAINTDITEQKKLEQQFLRAQRMESIGTLAGGIAHDLNNVLAPILMSLELLHLRFPDPASQELIDMIRISAQRGADMVSQVLSFSRGIEGRKLAVPMHQLIGDIEKIANDTFLKNIQVRTSVPPDLWQVTGDPTQLHQVLLNLCVNARDAMPRGGTLTISAENLTVDEQYASSILDAKPGTYVCLRVEDTGIGMSRETLDKIFDPFYTTKEIGKGTGLGLSTSLAIVKSHAGFFRVSSVLGRGAKFEVYLPASRVGSAASAQDPAQEMPRGHGELIMVVDDERPVREITRQTLETYGYRVVLAVDGADAIGIFARRQAEISAVLTDIMMPGLDGPATIQILQKMKPDLRIMAASGVATNGHAARVAACGVKHFLPKPYTASTMLKTLRELLTE